MNTITWTICVMTCRRSKPSFQSGVDSLTNRNGFTDLATAPATAEKAPLVFALVAENIDFASLGLSYGTSLRILLHKKTGEMIVRTEASGVIDALTESRQLAAELAPYWQEYKDASALKWT